jgi:hypothetical protein
LNPLHLMKNQRLLMNPNRLFLLDGIGGLLTGITIGYILPLLPQHFDLPVNVFKMLSTFGFLYGLYSLTCALTLKSHFSKWLRVIILANLIYCLISIFIMVYYFDRLSPLGLIYFTTEKFIILFLVHLEYKALKQTK